MVNIEDRVDVDCRKPIRPQIDRQPSRKTGWLTRFGRRFPANVGIVLVRTTVKAEASAGCRFRWSAATPARIHPERSLSIHPYSSTSGPGPLEVRR